MICQPCHRKDHAQCDGRRRHRTYCDCQHKPCPLPAATPLPVPPDSAVTFFSATAAGFSSWSSPLTTMPAGTDSTASRDEKAL